MITNTYTYNIKPVFTGKNYAEKTEKDVDIHKMAIYDIITHPDCFEIENPANRCYYAMPQKIDKTTHKKYTLVCLNPFQDDLELEYNPDLKGQLIDKKTNKPFDVNILKMEANDEKGAIIYKFTDDNFEKDYGYVWFTTPQYQGITECDLKNTDMSEINMGKERVIVQYLKNYDDKNIGGVGKLADKLEVKYCFENNIEPNIISDADKNSHVAHYKRGKRFITPPVGSSEYNFLVDKYGSPNPNEVLEELIEHSDGEKIDLTGWEFMVMYLPYNLIEKYKNE